MHTQAFSEVLLLSVLDEGTYRLRVSSTISTQCQPVWVAPARSIWGPIRSEICASYSRVWSDWGNTVHMNIYISLYIPQFLDYLTPLINSHPRMGHVVKQCLTLSNRATPFIKTTTYSHLSSKPLPIHSEDGVMKIHELISVDQNKTWKMMKLQLKKINTYLVTYLYSNSALVVHFPAPTTSTANSHNVSLLTTKQHYLQNYYRYMWGYKHNLQLRCVQGPSQEQKPSAYFSETRGGLFGLKCNVHVLGIPVNYLTPLNRSHPQLTHYTGTCRYTKNRPSVNYQMEFFLSI